MTGQRNASQQHNMKCKCQFFAKYSAQNLVTLHELILLLMHSHLKYVKTTFADLGSDISGKQICPKITDLILL